ncbi:MAG: rod shape-determining protein RodA [Candidatus Dadabacteria bacterium]|nr:MAG: rod shape-determining protein RodA [Candidatus Dadabacteria bacterium]
MSRKFQIDRDVAVALGVMVLIMCAGALSVHSAVLEQTGIFVRQLAWYGIGMVLMVGLAQIDYRWVVTLAGPVFAIVVLLLVGVLFVGQSGGGSQRWLGVGPLRLQPSEFAKVAVLLWSVHWCAKRPKPGGYTIRDLLAPTFVLLVPVVLTARQPDLGTAVAILVIGVGVFWVAGIERRLQFGLIVSGLVSVVLAWFYVLKPYQKKRIVGFLDPESDPLGAGYHIIQSKIAVGVGGVRGLGFGHGTQTQLRFLPEQHTDFIFAVWAEEWGFFGVCVVLALFAWLFWWLARTAIEARDTAGRLLTAGVLLHLALHVGMNLAMVAGWAPVVGLPLPWMTYGGSAILANSIALGLAFSVRQHRRMF